MEAETRDDPMEVTVLGKMASLASDIGGALSHQYDTCARFMGVEKVFNRDLLSYIREAHFNALEDAEDFCESLRVILQPTKLDLITNAREDTRLTLTAKLVYLYVVERLPYKDFEREWKEEQEHWLFNAEVRFSPGEIAEYWGITEKSVVRAISQLESCDLIESGKNRFRRRWDSRIFYLVDNRSESQINRIVTDIELSAILLKSYE